MRAVLTIRHGARVQRMRFDNPASVLAGLEERVKAVRREGPLKDVAMLRRFEPADRVAARLEISTGGFLRKREAGIDVMGDGELVAYSGGVTRRELCHGSDLKKGIEAVRDALWS